MSEKKAKVTVVISTYNRPDVLKVAIKSVILQSITNWKIYVIGDFCNQETEKVVASFNDRRIKYINLPQRVGTQSGPNSVGIALTMTEYIAFMNQDDIWLQDHLEYSLETLEKTKSDFFIGKCGFAHNSKLIDKNLKEPIFDFVNPDNRTADMSFYKANKLFESASSWVIKTTSAKKIGYWKHPREIHRPSLQNWVLRAWRNNIKFIFGKKITVLKINTHQLIRFKTKYSVKSLEHIYLQDLLEKNNSNTIRKFVEKSLEHNEKLFNIEIPDGISMKNKKILLNRFTKNLYKHTSCDCYELFFSLKGLEKGKKMMKSSMSRTGKQLPEKVDINIIVDEIKSNYPDILE